MTPPNLHVVQHPLVVHYLTVLRDKRTATREYRETTRKLSWLLVAEATADLPLLPTEIETPMEGGFVGGRLAKPTVLVAVLRAGLGMMEGALDLLGQSTIGYIGLQRDEETKRPVGYYQKLPPLSGCAGAGARAHAGHRRIPGQGRGPGQGGGRRRHRDGVRGDLPRGRRDHGPTPSRTLRFSLPGTTGGWIPASTSFPDWGTWEIGCSALPH